MDIIRTIQETATWIEKVNNDFETNLYRSPQVAPQRHLALIAKHYQAQVVNEVVKRRSNLLAETQTDLIPVEDLHLYGRIALFDINSSLTDGAAQAASENFVDIYETPPADTWLTTGNQLLQNQVYRNNRSFFRQAVIAWVPVSQYFYVDQASLVSMVDNILWLNPNLINDPYNQVQALFDSPPLLKLKKPSYSINYKKRNLLMHDFETTLDRKEYEFQKNRLNEKANRWIDSDAGAISNLWNWFTRILVKV